MALQLDSVSDLARRDVRPIALDSFQNREGGRRDRSLIIVAALFGLLISGVVAVTAAEAGPLFVVPLLLLAPAAIIFVRYPFVAVMLWLLIFPFVARDVVGFQAQIYRVVHLIMIPVTLWLVTIKSWAQGRKLEVKFGLPEYIMVLSLLWTIGNIYVFGTQPFKLVMHMYDRVFVPYSMYWLVRIIAPTPEDIRRLLPIAFFTLMVQAGIGILSWFYPSVLPLQWQAVSAEERVVGTFRNPAVYTSTLLFLAMLIFQYGMSSKARWLRALGILAIGLAFFCTLISFSRGSWLGGIVVLVGLTMLYPGVFIRLGTVGVLSLVILAGTVLGNEASFALERLNDENTAEGRLLSGVKSAGMIDRKPLFGWGYGNYDVYDEEFRVNVGDVQNLVERTSHNTYMTLMAEQGIPAAVLYLLPTFVLFLKSLFVWRRMPRQGFWSISLLAMLWLLIMDHITVSNFMDMIRYNYFGTTIYWIALALIATMVEQYTSTERQPVPSANPKGTFSLANFR